VSYLEWFLRALVLIPVTLLPIINPLSTAPVFVATVGTNRTIARRLARQVAINSWFVLVVSMLIGTYVLAFFGVSLPVVRLGGGLLVAATAWRLLHHTDDDDVHAVAVEKAATCRMPRSSSAASSRSPSRSPPARARSQPRSRSARRSRPNRRSSCWACWWRAAGPRSSRWPST
jgi:hypothetical protein